MASPTRKAAAAGAQPAKTQTPSPPRDAIPATAASAATATAAALSAAAKSPSTRSAEAVQQVAKTAATSPPSAPASEPAPEPAPEPASAAAAAAASTAARQNASTAAPEISSAAATPPAAAAGPRLTSAVPGAVTSAGATAKSAPTTAAAPQQLFIFEKALTERLQALALDNCTDELLVIEIDEDRNILRLAAATPFSGGLLQQRFQRVAAAAPHDAPRLFLLRLDIHSNTPVWLTISWTPAAVCSAWRRTYIDFAAWHLRMSLCLPRGFLYEYYASTQKSLGFSAYKQAARRASAREQQEQRLSFATFGGLWTDRSTYVPATSLETKEFSGGGQALDSFSASPGFTPSLAVEVDEEFPLVLQQFRENQISCLEIVIDDSTSTICALPCVYDSPGLLQQHAAGSTEPRYYLLHHNGITTFLLYCPEVATRHDRVLYAAFKRRVWEEIVCRGHVKVLSRVDVTSSADISEKLLACSAAEEIQQEAEKEQRRLALRVLQRGGSGGSSSEAAAALANLLGDSLVLLVSLPTKAAPPGEGWADGDVLHNARDSLSAWREAARLPPPQPPRDTAAAAGGGEEEHGVGAKGSRRRGSEPEATGAVQGRQSSRDAQAGGEELSNHGSGWDSESDSSCEEI